MAGDATTWPWWSSKDEEHYQGPFPSREDAIDDLDGEPGYICEAYQAPLKLSGWLDFDDMLERAENSLADSDQADPDGDNNFEMSDEQRRSFEACVMDAVDAWQARHKLVWLPWSFTEQRNREAVNQPDDTSSAEAQ